MKNNPILLSLFITTALVACDNSADKTAMDNNGHVANVKEDVKDTAHDVKEVAVDAAQATKDKAIEAGDAIKNEANKAKAATAGAISDTVASIAEKTAKDKQDAEAAMKK